MPTQFPTLPSCQTSLNRPRQVLQQYLKVEGLSVKYVGPGQDDSQAAAVRADNPVPPDMPLYYVEVLIVNRGVEGYLGEGHGVQG